MSCEWYEKGFVLQKNKRINFIKLFFLLESGTGGAECELREGSFAPQVVLFVAQLISGIGQPLYYTLGTSYMDDNIKKSKTAAFISKFSSIFTVFFFLTYLRYFNQKGQAPNCKLYKTEEKPKLFP